MKLSLFVAAFFILSLSAHAEPRPTTFEELQKDALAFAQLIGDSGRAPDMTLCKLFATPHPTYLQLELRISHTVQVVLVNSDDPLLVEEASLEYDGWEKRTYFFARSKHPILEVEHQPKVFDRVILPPGGDGPTNCMRTY